MTLIELIKATELHIFALHEVKKNNPRRYLQLVTNLSFCNFLLCIPSLPRSFSSALCALPLRLELPHFSRPALPDEFRDGFRERQIVVWPRGRVKGLQLYFSLLPVSLVLWPCSPHPCQGSLPTQRFHLSPSSSVGPAGWLGDVMGWIRDINQLV